MYNLNQKAIALSQDGIVKFAKLTSLRQNPIEMKWVQDELDVIFFLGIVKDKFRQTLPMMGKTKYKGTTEFDFIRDVKEEIEEVLFGGREKRDQLLNKKRYLMMYHLVIEPIIDLFQGLSHQEAVIHADTIIDAVIERIKDCDAVASYDDALVCREIVRKQIEVREEARRIAASKRRRNVKKKDPVKELLSEIAVEPVDEVVEPLVFE